MRIRIERETNDVPYVRGLNVYVNEQFAGWGNAETVKNYIKGELTKAANAPRAATHSTGEGVQQSVDSEAKPKGVFVDHVSDR